MTLERLPERIRSKVVVTDDGHWLWTGAASGGGRAGKYGYVWDASAGKTRRAHVVVYEILVGRVPAGHELDHDCRIRLCVNPRCLTPRTHLENVRRGLSGRVNNVQARKTHCPQGHPLSGANLYVTSQNKRHCRTCHRERMQARRAARS